MSEARIEKAVRDLERHTLAALPGTLARLVYLSSARDYNTGQYRHAGLEQTYTQEAAEAALRRCHASVFRDLAEEGVEALVEEICAYLAATREDQSLVLKTWRGLEIYRILVPTGCDTHVRDLFISNFSAALAVVRSKALPHDSPSAPQPL
jgi:hypothetical protein